MTDSTKDFPVVKFKAEMNALAAQYESRLHNKKEGSPDTEPTDYQQATPRTKSIGELTDAEFQERIYSQFGAD